VALSVEDSCTSGAMLLASGPDEAPPLTTAWQLPPVTPEQVPSARLPRGSGETLGSVAVTEAVILPVQSPAPPSQVILPPTTEAADGPAGIRAPFTGWPSLAYVVAAPGPVDAVDIVWTWQEPAPVTQLTVPSEVRGLPSATAPSQEAEVVCALPEQVEDWQSMLAAERDVEVGPEMGWPLMGWPVFGSSCRYSATVEASELAWPRQPPPLTVQSAPVEEPRRSGEIPVSSPLVSA